MVISLFASARAMNIVWCVTVITACLLIIADWFRRLSVHHKEVMEKKFLKQSFSPNTTGTMHGRLSCHNPASSCVCPSTQAYTPLPELDWTGYDDPVDIPVAEMMLQAGYICNPDEGATDFIGCGSLD